MALAITNLAKHAASIGTAAVVAFLQDTVRQQWLWGVIEHCCSVTAVVARRQGQLRHRAHPQGSTAVCTCADMLCMDLWGRLGASIAIAIIIVSISVAFTIGCTCGSCMGWVGGRYVGGIMVGQAQARADLKTLEAVANRIDIQPSALRQWLQTSRRSGCARCGGQQMDARTQR